jgi:hypothetical protein
MPPQLLCLFVIIDAQLPRKGLNPVALGRVIREIDRNVTASTCMTKELVSCEYCCAIGAILVIDLSQLFCPAPNNAGVLAD